MCSSDLCRTSLLALFISAHKGRFFLNGENCMNKISLFYGALLQTFGYCQRMQRDGACQYSISLPAFSAQNNKGNHKRGRFFRPLKAFFFLFLLLMLASCSNEPKLPEPPIVFPFSAWKAGDKLDFQFRVKEKYLYEFSIDIYYKEQAKDDYEDMERVRKLVGTYDRDSTGKINYEIGRASCRERV